MALTLNIKETAFAILHAQNDLVDEKGKFAHSGMWEQVKKINAVENIAKAAEASRKADMKVVYAMVRNRQKHYPDGEGRLYRIPVIKGFWAVNGCAPGTWGYETPELIKPQPDDIMIEEMFPNVFNSTDLDFILRCNDICNLVLAGFATNMVVNSTARYAIEMGYNVFFIKDCCASLNEEMHNFAVNIEFPMLGQVITVDEYIEALK